MGLDDGVGPEHGVGRCEAGLQAIKEGAGLNVERHGELVKILQPTGQYGHWEKTFEHGYSTLRSPVLPELESAL